MSSGHRGEDAASATAVAKMISKPQNSGLVYYLQRAAFQPVSRNFLVPYGAGKAADGGMTYVDEGVPARFSMGVEPDKYVNAHESIEWWLMTRRNLDYWIGPDILSAHWWATGYEHLLMRLDGYGDDAIAAYEAEWLTYVSADEAQRISPETVPPDLFTGAYEAGEDTDPSEQKRDPSILQTLLAARARAVPVRVTA